MLLQNLYLCTIQNHKMDKIRFTEILRNPSTNLTEEENQWIKSEKEKNPFCSLFSLVLLLSQKENDFSDCEGLLAETAVCVPDRKFLKQQMGLASAIPSAHQLQTAAIKDIPAIPVVEEKTVEPENGVDILEEIDAYQEISLKTASKKELIEKFLEIDSPKINKPNRQNEVDDKKHEFHETTHFVSETLALLYEKQGNYAKALKIYEDLILKYPEKNSTFASQIEKLKEKL